VTVVIRGPENGWHWKEWLAEAAGTAVLLFGVVTAKDLAVRAGPPFSMLPLRAAILGLASGLAVAAVAVSALGRRSGAHLNPALTLGLWLQRTVSDSDLAGYWVAQLAGAAAGVGLARVWGPSVAGRRVDWALIHPAPRLAEPAAAGIECGVTLLQLGLVFIVLSSQRRHIWAPAVSGALLAVAIFLVTPVTGAGINPVRGLAPDLLAAAYPAVWIYIAGPFAGAALAAAAATGSNRRPVTGKLRHDPSIPCHMRCALPHLTSPPGLTGRSPSQRP
jgi:aquaporin Z